MFNTFVLVTTILITSTVTLESFAEVEGSKEEESSSDTMEADRSSCMVRVCRSRFRPSKVYIYIDKKVEGKWTSLVRGENFDESNKQKYMEQVNSLCLQPIEGSFESEGICL